MEEYINKIKYLKERVKLSLKDANNTDNGELMSKEEVLKSTEMLKKLADENKDKELKYNLYIFSSQLLLLKYEDLDKMLEIASEIVIRDNCLLYDTFKNIIDKENNMREIKPGDKIKVIGMKGEISSYSEIVGNIYVVEDIDWEDDGTEFARLENCKFTPYLHNCELVDEKEKQFTKLDLKDGDKIICRNKNVGYFNKQKNKIIFAEYVLLLSSYKEDLTNIYDKKQDIIKVERLVQPELVYKREEPTEMKLEEICEELGRDIKIVKEH